MTTEQNASTLQERRTVLGLWGVPGVGSKTLGMLRSAIPDLASVCELPVPSWVKGLDLPLPARQGLARVERVADVADALAELARRGQMQIAFPGDAAYPAQLVDTPDAPPLLFVRGNVGPPVRRAAMVGSRKVKPRDFQFARAFARDIAARGVGIVSGAAEGIDQACHRGAIDAGQQTWAFVGSALDELDASQAALLPSVLDAGGAFFSELPPGVRADKTTFPRRNRLIPGSSDAVVVVRAGARSGTLHTAKAALRQGRPVLAVPGDLADANFDGCHGLIQRGEAQICVRPEDVWSAIGITETLLAPPRREGGGTVIETSELSVHARTTYKVLDRTPQDFESIEVTTGLNSGELCSALCELELLGLVVQRAGKRYEKV